MAWAGAVGCGMLAALAAWLLCGAWGVARRPGGEDGYVRAVVASALGSLGATRPVTLLSRIESWRIAADELVLDDALAGIVRGREAGLALLVCIVASSALAGLVCARSAVGLVVGLGCALAGVPAWARSRTGLRERELARQVPETFRSLAGAMAAGRTLSQAIAYVGSRGDGPLYREFSRASLAVSCGVGATEAVEEIARRTQAPGVSLMVCALVVSSRTGAPLQGLFARSARLVEERFELERELVAKTAQVRLSARVVSALPACMVGALALISPDFRLGLATPVGGGCVCAAVLLDAVALLVIRRLMRSVM